jgi:hypothetical protein
LDAPSATANHALHEPVLADIILICCYQAIALSLILTDISHSDTTLAFGKLNNAVQEFQVSANFGEPVFEDVNGLHECDNPASMITEQDVQASLLDLTATWTKGVNGFVPRNISIGRGYPHYLFARPDLEKPWNVPKAGVDALPAYFIEGLGIKDIALIKTFFC